MIKDRTQLKPKNLQLAAVSDKFCEAFLITKVLIDI